MEGRKRKEKEKEKECTSKASYLPSLFSPTPLPRSEAKLRESKKDDRRFSSGGGEKASFGKVKGVSIASLTTCARRATFAAASASFSRSTVVGSVREMHCMPKKGEFALETVKERRMTHRRRGQRQVAWQVPYVYPS